MSILKRILTILIGGLIVLVAAVSVLMFYRNYQYTPDSADTTNQDKPTYYDVKAFRAPDLHDEFLASFDNDEELSGSLLITSIKKIDNKAEPLDESGKALPFSAFVLDLDDNQYKTADSYPERANYAVRSHLSSNQYLYVATTTNSSYSIFLQTGSTTSVLPAEADLKKEVRRRLPRWSSNDKFYLYTGRVAREDQSDVFDINTWSIFVDDVGGDYRPVKFADGYGAVWALNDDYIVYVKENGVYAKRFVPGGDHLNEPEIRVTAKSYKHALRNHIGVSPDGKYLAVVYPIIATKSDSFIDIFKLSIKEDKLGSQLIKTIDLVNVAPLWPIFSPGGRYLSMQSVGQTENGANDINILIYDFVRQDFVRQIDFDDFYFEYSFNIDWVKKLKI